MYNNVFKKFIQQYKKNGLVGSIHWLFVKIQRKFIKRQILFFVELTEINDNDFLLPDNITIEIVKSENEIGDKELKRLIEGGTALMGNKAKQMIKERFAKGALLWLMKMNDQFAGYSWTISKDTLRPTYMPYTEKDVHGIGDEIFEEFHNQGLHRIFVKYQLINMKNEGFLRFFGEIYVWNKPSLRSYGKTEMRKLGIAKKRFLGGRNIVTWYEMYNRK